MPKFQAQKTVVHSLPPTTVSFSVPSHSGNKEMVFTTAKPSKSK